MKAKKRDERIRLFDGETLEGWGITGNPQSWVVEDGCVRCRALKGKYLHTLRNDFRDFELSLSFKHDAGANSGVFFRWTDLENPVQTGIEIQILDTHGKEPSTVKCSGALYDCKAPIRSTCKPAGEWNTMVLKADGSNGVHTSSCASGFFGFVFRRASSRLRKRPNGAFTSCSSHASYAMSRCSVGSPALARTISRNDVRR